MKKVFIIEDNVYDYKNIIGILDTYNVEYFPKKAEIDSYSKLYSHWAINQEDKDYETIKEAIDSFNPDYILLDIGLSADQLSNDDSGYLLKDKLLDVHFPKIPIRKITARYPVSDDCIRKEGDHALGDELYTKFLSPEKINKKHIENSNLIENNTIPSGDTVANPNTLQQLNLFNEDDNNESRRYSEPIIFDNFKVFVSRKIQPVITYLLHIVITIVFYILIGYLFYLGADEIFHANDGHHNILEIAETSFVAFLPLLVVFGFFVFYRDSLSPFLLGNVVRGSDLERSSGIISFTKKLFISSLISYLFTKSIELLFLDTHTSFVSEFPNVTSKLDSIRNSELLNNPNLVNNKFLEYHNTNYPYAQLLAIGSIIILLSLYYIYLNSHNSSFKGKHPKD